MDRFATTTLSAYLYCIMWRKCFCSNQWISAEYRWFFYWSCCWQLQRTRFVQPWQRFGCINSKCGCWRMPFCYFSKNRIISHISFQGCVARIYVSGKKSIGRDLRNKILEYNSSRTWNSRRWSSKLYMFLTDCWSRNFPSTLTSENNEEIMKICLDQARRPESA